jgi:sulfate transport system permease protein
MNTLVTSRSSANRVIPGFGLSLGFTIFYLALIVLIPLSAIFLKTFTMSWDAFWNAVTSERVMASYRLSFGAALIGAAINVVFGGIVAWVLVRYQFPGKRFIDALVDLPFALPTAVAGITLTALYSSNGWIGKYLEPLGIKVAFTPLGVVVALTFIGLPFVVRTVQPVLEDAERELEESAASRWSRRSRRCSSSPSWSSTTTRAPPRSPWSCWSLPSSSCWPSICCRPGHANGRASK